jgi:cytochrome c biogenesis protein CcmG/thiol:disulfide interchange protein DsbE
MRRLLNFLPTGLFALVAFAFFHELNTTAPNRSVPSLVDEPAPQTTLPALGASAKGFGATDLRAGHVSVVNVWASWCAPCRAEAPALAALSRLKGVSLYGVVYEDRASAAQQFLEQAGNPFSRIDIDRSGHAGREWKISGVPETFVIDGRGTIRLHYAGPIVGDALDHIILPAIARARTSG